MRGITNWGEFLLPKPLTIHQQRYRTGHYFIMRFDSSARAQHAVRRTLSLDPRLVRYSVVKMGIGLDQVRDVGGKAEWPSAPEGGIGV